MRKKLIAFPALIIASMAFIFAAQVTPSSPVEQTIFKTMGVQSGPTWGLDRIDGLMDGQYSYGGTGAGVRIYIVDTGVDSTHPDLRGRVIDGFDAFGENLDQTDCNGHGTHVAGGSAGTYFGAAKAATIVPVRVMNCAGVGNTETVEAGLSWIIENHPPGTAGVVNMSLGGPKSLPTNEIVESVIRAGLTVVVAAGNAASDACNYSPGSAAGVIVVGATDQYDLKATFSNYGSCVDLYAPGVRINSADAFNHNVSKSRNGTSHSAAFASGVIAINIAEGLPLGPATRNNILQVFHTTPEAVVPEPEKKPESPIEPTVEETPESPIEPTVEETQDELGSPTIQQISYAIIDITASAIELGWNAVQGASGYSVSVGEVGGLGYSHKKNSSNTNTRVSNLKSNTLYWVQVSPLSSTVKADTGPKVRFTTAYGLPSKPRELRIHQNILSWLAPSYSGGDSKLYYSVEQMILNSWVNIGVTSEKDYRVPVALLGSSETYRIRAVTVIGAGEPSNFSINKGTGASLVEEAPELSKDLAGTVTATQRGFRSVAVIISWEKVAGAVGYEILSSPVGLDSWGTLGATNGQYSSRTVGINADKDLQVKVVASLGDGTKIELGTIQYQPLK
jgi:hypothetical protein